MNVQPNYVLVLPDKNHVAGTHGMDMPDFVSPQHNFAVTGTVVSAPKRLNYFGRQIKAIKRKMVRDVWDERLLRDWMAGTVNFDVPVEIKAGDTVIFPYIHRLDDKTFDEERHGEFLLLPYDTLTARVDGGELYPLNGNVLGRKIVPEQGLFKGRRVFWDSVCEVVAEGCMVRGYCDWGLADKESVFGRKVIVMQNMAVSIERPHHLRAAKEELFMFHRRHILGYVQA